MLHTSMLPSERDQLVRSLVIDSVERLRADQLGLWLHTILEDGFIGFANMNEEDLLRECIRRGLRLEEHFEELPHEEYDDDPDDDEEELLGLFAHDRQGGLSANS